MQERTVDFTAKDGFRLNGTLCMPVGPVRGVALIIAGSGPTDRDGNSSFSIPGADMFSAINLHRDLAAHYAARGIATLRYDKRSCADYAEQHGQRAAQPGLFSFDNLVADADCAANILLAQPESSGHSLTIAGHSEGGLVALILAQRRAVDTLYLLATCGRTLRTVIRNQLYDRYLESTGDTAGAAVFAAKADEAMTAITDEKPLPPDMPQALSLLFNDHARAHFRQSLDIDPVTIARTLVCDVLVVNGTSDIQVSHTADAAPLFTAFAQRALPHARQELTMIDGASHCFKQPAHPLDHEGSFKGPVAPGLFRALDAFICRPKPDIL